jgi:hypothetical protein
MDMCRISLAGVTELAESHALFRQEIILRRCMRRVAGGAVIVRHRRMQKSAPLCFAPMTTVAQLAPRRDQQRITVAAVRPMTEGAVAGSHRWMHHFAGLKGVHMAEAAQAARISGQKIGIIARVGIMAGGAAGFDHRVYRIPSLQPGTMTLEAEAVFLPGKLSMTAGTVRLMAEAAVAARGRWMDNRATFGRVTMATGGKAIVTRQNTGGKSEKQKHKQIEE